LRELEADFNAQSSHHYHLVTRRIKRFTSADANSNLGYILFEALAEQVLSDSHRKLCQQCRKVLYLLDSSPIHLIGVKRYLVGRFIFRKGNIYNFAG